MIEFRVKRAHRIIEKGYVRRHDHVGGKETGLFCVFLSSSSQMQVGGARKEGTPVPNAGGVGHITTEEAAMGTQVVRGMRPIDAALSCWMHVWPPGRSNCPGRQEICLLASSSPQQHAAR